MPTTKQSNVIPMRDDKMPEIVMIPPHQLVGDDNIRHNLGDLTELTESVRNLGVLEPLLVTWIEPPEGFVGEPGYRIAAGHRRHAAALRAKLEYLPCIVREFGDAERLAVMIAENMRRKELTPMEEAEAFARAVGLGMTKKDLAKRVGVKESYLNDRLPLLELTAEAAKALEEGTITLKEAGWFLTLKDLPSYATETRNLLKRKTSGINLYEGTFTDVVKKHQRKAKVAEHEAEAKRRGWALVKTAGGYNPTPVTGVTCERLGIEGKELTKHKKLSCHGLMIVNDTYSGVKAVHCCTDPERHKAADAKVYVPEDKVTAATAAPAPSYSNNESEEAQARRLAAEERHREFLLQHIGGLGRSEQIAAILQYVAGTARAEEALILGVQGATPEELRAGVHDYAARSSINLVRVAYACTLTEEIRFGRWEDPNGRVEKLIPLGYEPNEEEQAFIDKLTADRATQAQDWLILLNMLTDETTDRIAVLRARWEATDWEIREFVDAWEGALADQEDTEQANASVNAMLDLLERDLDEQSGEGGEREEGAVGVYAGDEDNGDEITSGPAEDDPEWEVELAESYDGMDAAELVGEEYQAGLD